MEPMTVLSQIGLAILGLVLLYGLYVAVLWAAHLLGFGPNEDDDDDTDG